MIDFCPRGDRPANPPVKDYFFQYSWVVPGIFNAAINLRRHHYFGSQFKDHADFLFDFWGEARKGHGTAVQLYCRLGVFSRCLQFRPEELASTNREIGRKYLGVQAAMLS